eukprot:XP_011666444.1 PREDICTED: N-acetylated-alpha-linked acidic dipeptidase 2 [Strongylocentrotus purpuratus]
MFVVGLLIGLYGISDGPCSTSSSTSIEDETISGMMMEECKAEYIEQNLRLLSSRPHLAGTPAEKENAEMLVNLWTEYGFDSVRLLPFDVLLAYPDPDNPNKVMITDNGVPIFTSALTEAVLRPEDNNTDVVPPFNAYSAQGEPEGPLVYVNHGTSDDFEWLAKNRPDININGSIVIVKYGKGFRGHKVLNAQKAGALGVIIYSDPANYAREDRDTVYPNDWWLPDTGTQRGNVFVGSAKGDPVTPGYPSKPYMYRLNDSDTSLPTIPVHPIGYGDAQHLLSELGGDEVQDTWKGGLNITYRYGPGFTNPNSYPVYHSVYENFYYVKNFLDWNFWRHQAMARVYLEFSRDLADSVILPFGCVDYAAKLKQATQGLERNFGKKMAQNGIDFDYMESALDNFTEAAQHFEMRLSDVNVNDPYAVRRVNDQMMQLERAFIDPIGLPGRKWLRHLIFAPSSVDSYAGDEFPGVVDALYQIDDDPDQETRWNNVRKQLAILTFTIQSAASTLNDATQL